MSVTLKPCPFCGGPARLRSAHGTDAWVVCDFGPDDVCGAETRLFDTPAEAIAAWNRRAAPDAREAEPDGRRIDGFASYITANGPFGYEWVLREQQVFGTDVPATLIVRHVQPEGEQ